MSIETGTKINNLLSMMRPYGLLFSGWLNTCGYSDQLQKRYRDTGWLSALSKGVMYRTGAKLSAYQSLSAYNEQLNIKSRVAAMSALEYAGYNHYVPMGKPALMVALPYRTKRPAWMNRDIFDMTFETFTTKVFSHIEVNAVSDDEHMYVSSPEQAFLECLLLAPEYYDYTDLYYVMEQLTTLRSDVLQRILEGVNNYRVKRIFMYMAEKAEHYWFQGLNLDRIDLGSSKLQLVKNGVYNAKYKMTIPKELESYEG
jgi:hypothetical protein